VGANTVTVDFEVDTDPANATYPLTVEWYRTGPFGQAGAYLGGTTIAATDAQTPQSETFTPQVPLTRQDFVVATVTTADGRTSEINPLTQTVTVVGAGIATYTFDYLEVRVAASGPQNGTSPLTVRYAPRDPENGPPSGTALAVAGSWTFTSGGSVAMDQLCIPLDNLINDPGQVNESALTVYSRASASDSWIARSTGLRSIDGNDYVCGGGPLSDEYIVAADPSELPVELAGFGATQTENAVHLRWQTTSETNNAGFHLERAVDGGGFTEVGFVEGAGTTTEARRYRFADRRLPFAADSLTYRLRQVDLDGTTAVSDPVVVALGTPDRLALLAPYPNPAHAGVTLRYALPRTTDARVEVYNVLGQRVAVVGQGRQAAGRVEQYLDTSRFPSGLYFVRLMAGGQIQTERITVVR
jgi:hypothetical protein